MTAPSFVEWTAEVIQEELDRWLGSGVRFLAIPCSRGSLELAMSLAHGLAPDGVEVTFGDYASFPHIVFEDARD